MNVYFERIRDPWACSECIWLVWKSVRFRELVQNETFETVTIEIYFSNVIWDFLFYSEWLELIFKVVFYSLFYFIACQRYLFENKKTIVCYHQIWCVATHVMGFEYHIYKFRLPCFLKHNTTMTGSDGIPSILIQSRCCRNLLPN